MPYFYRVYLSSENDTSEQTPLIYTDNTKNIYFRYVDPDTSKVVYTSLDDIYDSLSEHYHNNIKGGTYTANMQGDGNLVVYNTTDGSAIWNSQACCQGLSFSLSGTTLTITKS